MKIKTLEVVLLFILVINLFRAEQITNQSVIFIAAVLIIIFSFISIFGFFKKNRDAICLWCLVLLVVLVHGFLLVRVVSSRRVAGSKSLHDGVIMTEASYRALTSFRNPYSENLSDVLVREKYTDVSIRSSIHYPYSPLMFLTSVPVFWVTDGLFGIVDMRVTLFVFFLLAAWIGSLMVKEKILFLILFLFNPLFVPMLFYGANEAILLFFLVLMVYFLNRSPRPKGRGSLIFAQDSLHLRPKGRSFFAQNKKMAVLATVTLGLASSVKLFFLPALPLYFVYIYLTNSRSMKVVLKHLQIFLIVSLFVYLPFLIWNSSDTINALLSPWFGTGEELYPIAGFIGIAQVLTSLEFVSKTTSFPFLLLFLPFEVFFLAFSFKVLKKSLIIHTLTFLFAFNFILVLAFSRLVQTYYLAFITQVMLLAGFLPSDKKDTTGL